MPATTNLPWRVWRNLPNCISVGRMCVSLVLLFVVAMHRAEDFKWLLLTCLLSDILDGFVARIFHLASKLGALLDSVADVFTMFAGMAGLLTFQREFVSAHWAGLLLVAVLYVVEVGASVWRYGKVSSFHTVLAGIAAYMAGLFVMLLLFRNYYGWLFYMTVTVYVVELSEEMVLIYLLPEWRSDVGGMFRVLGSRVVNL